MGHNQLLTRVSLGILILALCYRIRKEQSTRPSLRGPSPNSGTNTMKIWIDVLNEKESSGIIYYQGSVKVTCKNSAHIHFNSDNLLAIWLT